MFPCYVRSDEGRHTLVELAWQAKRHRSELELGPCLEVQFQA